MTTIVIDASIVVTLLATSTVDELLWQRVHSPRIVHAPHLLDAEVVSGIRGLVLGRKVTHARAMEMLRDFAGLRIIRHAMHPYHRRVMELRNNLTAYDAFYVALAEALNAQLLTRDVKFSRAAGHEADIHVYP